MEQHFDHLEKSELFILGRVKENMGLSEGDYKDLEDLSLAYEGVSEGMLKIKTPEVLKKEHLELANYFFKISVNLSNIVRDFSVDPILATYSIENYYGNGDTAFSLLKKLENYFSENEVVFRKGEPGELFSLYYKE